MKIELDKRAIAVKLHELADLFDGGGEVAAQGGGNGAGEGGPGGND